MGTHSPLRTPRSGSAALFRILALLLLATSTARADFMAGQVVDGFGVGVAGVDIDVKNTGSGGTDPIFNDGTDPNGFFLTTISPSIYRVTFNPPPPPLSTSLVLSIEDVVISGTTDLGVIQLPQGVALAGRCVTGQGFPAASVGLDVKDGATGADVVLKGDTTTLFGTFSIAVPTGPINVHFLTKGVLGFTLAPRSIPLNLSVDTDLGDVVLEDGFLLSATITNPQGGVIPNCDTDVLDSLTGEKLFTPNDNTNAQGVANVVVPAGTHDFVVQPPFGLHLVSKTVPAVVVTGNTPLGTLALDSGFVLSGTVLADGAPLQGINIDVEEPLTTASVTLSGDSTSAAGFYQVIVPPGTWTVQFAPPSGLPYDQVTVPGVIVSGPTTVNGNLPFCPTPCGPAAILSATPATGHPTGGTRVTLLGENFRDDGSISVDFGGVPGVVAQVIVPDTLLVDTPPGASGAVVDISLTSSNGPAVLAGGFTYDDPPPPVLTGVAPDAGLFHTPTPVTLIGTDFDPLFPTTVTLGALAMIDVTWVDGQTLTATVPAGVQGQLDDVVVTQDGASSTLPDAFAWIGTDIVSVTPGVGHPAVATPVSIAGSFFAPDSTASFGGVPATVSSVTPTTIEALVPPGLAGSVVDLVVTGSDGTDTLPGGFSFLDPPPPVLTGITPASGLFHSPTPVTLAGSDFDSFFSTTVTFGGVPAVGVTWVDSQTMIATAPAGTQGALVDVVLTQDGASTTLPAAWSWSGTTLSGVEPDIGHPGLPTEVTIRGALIAADSTVTFGGVPGQVLGVTPDQLHTVAPPGPAGTSVDITVTGSDGSATLPSSFHYEDPPVPVLVGTTPSTGLFSASTAVVLSGQDFDSFFPLSVSFGGQPATEVVWVSSTQVSCVAPPGSQGQLGDIVLTQNGASTTLPGAFTWVGTSIASVTPASGHPALETPVTLSGELFAADSTVTFGGVPGTVLAVTPTSMDVTAPVGTPGSVVDVTVTGSDGTDTAVGAFTYDDPLPAVLTAVAPASGLFHAPTPVTLTGTDFDAFFPIALTVGGLPATDVVRVTDTTVTATLPANTQGALGDIVLTQNGASTTLPAAFTWVGTSILSLTPAAGLPTGGTQVTLLGQHLPDDGSLSILLGGSPAGIVSVSAPGSVIFTTPPGQPATSVDVLVSGSNGTDTLPGGFLYDDAPPPVLASIAPTEGLFHSPTDVTLTGSDFSATYPLSASVGGLPVANLVRVSDTLLTGTVPANSQGALGDVVLTQNGHATQLTGAFYWVGTAVATLVPASGHPAVETLVTLTGEHFAPDTTVTFGGQAGAVLTNTGSVLEVLAPTGASAAVVDVVVSGSDGTHTLTAGFAYDDPPSPTLAGVTPAESLFHSPTLITLTGTDFDAFFSVSVHVGGLPASSVNRISSTEITALVPANTQGAVGDITLTQDGRTVTLPDAWRWVGTELTSLTPANGHPAVETQTTLTGLRIAADSTVTFGGVPGTVLATTPTSIDVAAPVGTPGSVVDVTVTGSDGTDTLPGAFTYDTIPAPTLASVTPNRGLFHTPTDVMIAGTGFDEHYPLALTVAGLPVTNVVRVSDTQLTATFPAHVQDAAGDLLIVQDGQTATLPDAFTWEGTRLLTVAPNKGHPNGGVTLTISGEHFVDDGSVSLTFGATPVTIMSVTVPDTLTVISPAGPAGAIVDVTITGSNGTDTLAGAFTFVDPLAPTLVSVSPSSGLFHSSTPVTLTGSDFDPLGVLSVTFAGVSATDVSWLSPTQISATAPPGLQGQVADVVVDQDGKVAVLGAAFTWIGTEIASIAPDHGHPAVETPVGLAGSLFAPDASIRFGDTPGTVLFVTTDSIQAIAPPGTPGQSVDVTVSGTDGTDTLVGGFRWDDVPAPTLATVDPAQGLFHSTTPVTLTGSGFDEHFPLAVSFGGVPATDVVRVSSTQLTCTAPTGTQDTVGDVVVTQNAQSATLPGAFAWYGTHLFAVSPQNGHPAGGTLVTLTGEHFTQDGATQVRFGGVPAADVTVVSDTTLAALTPAGTPGATVDVEISGVNGEDILPSGYTYDDPLAPKLLSVGPSSGLFHAATLVTLTGESFDPLATLSVTFDGQQATDVTFISSTQLTARTPPGMQGELVTVTVTQDGHSATLPNAFGYVGTRLTALDPPQGPPVGGPAVTLTGTFIPDDGSVSVTFGTLRAQVLSITVPDTVVVAVPVGTPGATVDVSITSTNGEDTLPGAFTYEVMGLVALSPDTGPAAGGPPVTLTGQHFVDDGSLQVDFGGLPAEVVSVDNAMTMTVELPAGARGSVVDVTVRGTNGTATLPQSFTYAITTLASANPTLGPPTGGETVVILGESFVDDGSTQVFFGGVPAEILDIEVPHTLTATVPAGSADSVVDILVSSSNGQDVLPAAYTYGDFMLLLGDGVDGEITSGDVDTVFFDALQDSRITLQMQAVKGSGIAPRMRLIAPDQTVLLTDDASAPKGKVARVKNLTLPATGRYRLELRGDGSSTGAYRFRSKLRPITKVNAPVFVNAATPVVPVTFGALPGWELRKVKVVSKKSKKAPAVLIPSLALDTPDGGSVQLAPFTKVNKTGTTLSLKGVPLDTFGTWTLRVSGAEGSTGEAKVAIKLRKPKVKPKVVKEP